MSFAKAKSGTAECARARHGSVCHAERGDSCQYYILCLEQIDHTSDATSHLDNLSVNRVIVGGERERGANERIQ